MIDNGGRIVIIEGRHPTKAAILGFLTAGTNPCRRGLYGDVDEEIRESKVGKGRLEAFSDGVLAIIITIMVLELKVPHGEDLEALAPLVPVFFSYVLSFVYVGIYWNNHHHMLHTAHRVTGPILWANLHLLFWLSLFPFVTGWMGENHFAAIPSAVYGGVLFMAAVAYWILEQTIIKSQGNNSILRTALGSDWKGKSSPVAYAVAVLLAFWSPSLAQGIYVLVALIWLIPDRRIEIALAGE
jgi:uncharacterized membrane protein